MFKKIPNLSKIVSVPQAYLHNVILMCLFLCLSS